MANTGWRLPDDPGRYDYDPVLHEERPRQPWEEAFHDLASQTQSVLREFDRKLRFLADQGEQHLQDGVAMRAELAKLREELAVIKARLGLDDHPSPQRQPKEGPDETQTEAQPLG